MYLAGLQRLGVAEDEAIPIGAGVRYGTNYERIGLLISQTPSKARVRVLRGGRWGIASIPTNVQSIEQDPHIGSKAELILRLVETDEIILGPNQPAVQEFIGDDAQLMTFAKASMASAGICILLQDPATIREALLNDRIVSRLCDHYKSDIPGMLTRLDPDHQVTPREALSRNRSLFSMVTRVCNDAGLLVEPMQSDLSSSFAIELINRLIALEAWQEAIDIARQTRNEELMSRAYLAAPDIRDRAAEIFEGLIAVSARMVFFTQISERLHISDRREALIASAQILFTHVQFSPFLNGMDLNAVLRAAQAARAKGVTIGNVLARSIKERATLTHIQRLPVDLFEELSTLIEEQTEINWNYVKPLISRDRARRSRQGGH